MHGTALKLTPKVKTSVNNRVYAIANLNVSFSK